MRSTLTCAADVGASARAEAVRLFAAVELPDSWRDQIARVQAAQRRAAPDYFRYVQPGALHLTVVFLGYQPSEALPSISAALERAASRVRGFALAVADLGTFGAPLTPRVLWVGVREPSGRLLQLRNEIDRELAAAGIAFDAKPLVPHITLGRARRGGGRFRLTQSLPDMPAFEVQRLALFESQLTPSGPLHTVRTRADLAAQM